MSDFEDILSHMQSDTDGRAEFVRLNRALASQIACIYPMSLSCTAFILIVKCLANVPRFAGEGSDEQGRWSYPFSTEDLICDNMSDQRLVGKESNTNKAIRTLLRLKMFYRFTVDGGTGSATVYTYNRYPFLNGVFWPQHTGSSDYGNSDFSPPTVPRSIAVLTCENSYMNAVARLTKVLHNKLRDKPNWKTLQQTRDNIKTAFCSKFIKELIDGACPSVKAKFVCFKDSRMSPDEYVRYVRQTALELPQYEGVDITKDFIESLNLPSNYMKEVVRKYFRDSAQEDVVKDHFEEEIHIGNDVEEVTITSAVGNSPEVTITSEGGGPRGNHYLYEGGLEVTITSDFEAKNGDKYMTSNDLQADDSVHQRVLKKDKRLREERENLPLNGIEKKETDHRDENGSSDGHAVEVQYNADMNKRKDMSLNQEEIDKYSFAMPDLVPVGLRSRSLIAKPQKKRAPNDERKVMDQMAKDGERIIKRAERTVSSSILNSADKFIAEFRKIVKEVIPSAKPPASTEQDINDRRLYQVIVDKLRERGALDEDVLREWMRHTARSNSKNRGFIGVSSMLSSLSSFEKHIPTAETVERIRKIRHAPVVKRKNVVASSMDRTFKEGFVEGKIAVSCQLWGIPMTAQYIASKTSPEEATRLVASTLRGCTIPVARGAMSITSKFGDLLEGMVLSDWRTVLSDLVSKVGRIESFEMTDTDRSNVEDFVTQFGGAK